MRYIGALLGLVGAIGVWLVGEVTATFVLACAIFIMTMAILDAIEDRK